MHRTRLTRAVPLSYGSVELRPVIHNEDVCQVSTLLTLLSGVLTAAGGGGSGGPGTGAALQLAPDHFERLFLFCLTWSLGGLLDGKDRGLFDAKLRTLTSQAPEQVRKAQGGSLGWQGGQGFGCLSLKQPLCAVLAALGLGGVALERGTGTQVHWPRPCQPLKRLLPPPSLTRLSTPLTISDNVKRPSDLSH